MGGAKDKIKKLVNATWLTTAGNGIPYLGIERLSENIVKRLNHQIYLTI